MRMKIFADRQDAGRQLASALKAFCGRKNQLVLALPRGGVPVASEVAAALPAPLGLLIVRKIGAPGQPELAIGAVASGGVVIRNEEIIDLLGLSDDAFERSAARAKAELADKERLYGSAAVASMAGQTVILVDDGAATGATMRAAIVVARAGAASRIVVALPTAAAEAAAMLAREADELVCIETPEPYVAVGYWYRDFRQVADEEVRRLMEASSGPTA